MARSVPPRRGRGHSRHPQCFLEHLLRTGGSGAPRLAMVSFEGLTFPLQMHQGADIRWVEASYTAIHHVLTNPAYAGAYALWQIPSGDDAERIGRP